MDWLKGLIYMVYVEAIILGLVVRVLRATHQPDDRDDDGWDA